MGHGKALLLGLLLTQAILSLFEGLFGAIALVAQALEFFAQIASVLGSLLGFLFPLIAALSEFAAKMDRLGSFSVHLTVSVL